MSHPEYIPERDAHSRSPRPVVVEPLEQFDDEDGLPEKLAQKNPRYQV